MVMPCMVKSPVTSKTSLRLVGAILVDLKVISGNLSVSKKSALRRCLSRSATPVSMVAVLMVTLTDDAAGLALSMLTMPETSANLPLTLLMKWRTRNMASEWRLSTVNASVAAEASDAAPRSSAAAVRDLNFMLYVSFR